MVPRGQRAGQTVGLNKETGGRLRTGSRRSCSRGVSPSRQLPAGECPNTAQGAGHSCERTTHKRGGAGGGLPAHGGGWTASCLVSAPLHGLVAGSQEDPQTVTPLHLPSPPLDYEGHSRGPRLPLWPGATEAQPQQEAFLAGRSSPGVRHTRSFAE